MMKKMLIVGGGSAGWMAALYLNQYLNKLKNNVEITLVESEDVGAIGVGEATVHSIRYFFASLGIDENELIKETHATLKTGILFRNWMRPNVDGVHEYFHPFEPNGQGDGLDLSSLWLLSGRQKSERYDQGVCCSSELIDKSLTPKSKNSRPYSGLVPYGYHLDAVLMAQFLRKKAVAGGVKHIVGNVSEVDFDGENIRTISLDDGRVLDADIYLDCTGFSGLLLNQFAGDNWQSYEDALPCNRAVALQLPYKAHEISRPYTTATALSNGWVWEIDLTSRRGTGYVYDGNRLSAEQAEAELRKHLQVDADEGKARHLSMNIGRRKEFWRGNCIAIGLSGGFIEPLESTGLHIINIGVKLAATHLTSDCIQSANRRAYNRAMAGIYEDLKQFIVLHYCLTDRDDTEFWRQAQESVKYCDGLSDKLNLWQHKICEYIDLAGRYTTTFTDENYRYVLYGMNHFPSIDLQVDEMQAAQILDRQKSISQRLCEQALPQNELFPRQTN